MAECESFCVTVSLCGGGLVIITPINDERGREGPGFEFNRSISEASVPAARVCEVGEVEYFGPTLGGREVNKVCAVAVNEVARV